MSLIFLISSRPDRAVSDTQSAPLGARKRKINTLVGKLVPISNLTL